MSHTILTVLDYHEQTKHHPYRYARSLGYLDWNTQPNPFRCYEGCEKVKLPFLEGALTHPHNNLFVRNTNDIKNFSLENISGMIELSLGLSAWKQAGPAKWALRMNPSSGNLHPTESYWLIPQAASDHWGLFHYNPLQHELEMRAKIPADTMRCCEQHFGSEGFFVALSSIYWRESWKYGERAFRYCQHDVGHALAALRFAANLMGWGVSFIQGLSDLDLNKVLGFDQTTWVSGEKEKEDLICWIHPNDTKIKSNLFPAEILHNIQGLSFSGTPNRLSPDNIDWPIIEAVSQASENPGWINTTEVNFSYPDMKLSPSHLSAAQVIRERRSAVSFHREHSHLEQAVFFSCLDACLYRHDHAPFDLGLMAPQVHLFIFVHHVTGLDPGFYALVRNPEHLVQIRAETDPRFLWHQVSDGFPLYLLKKGDYRDTAMQVSCGQSIAGESAFALGMVARFRENIEKHPHLYKFLFWETGIIGQVLYLQSEAYGLRGTGIGCFFDDPMHEICAFKGNTYQSLYHFTVGYPEEDSRITTLAPYQHLPHHA